MSIQTLETKLRNLDRQSQRLRKQLEIRKDRQYKAIPAKYGFKSMDAFIKALTPYVKGRRPGNGAAGAVRTRPARAATTTAPRGRKRYSDQQKATVKAALQKGGVTVPQLSKQSGVAEYTIIDWKKRWGLVKKRRKAAAKKK